MPVWQAVYGPKATPGPESAQRLRKSAEYELTCSTYVIFCEQSR